MAVTRGAVHAAFLSVLWRLSALHGVDKPDGRDVEALAAARSTFTGQLEAISDSTELVSTPHSQAASEHGNRLHLPNKRYLACQSRGYTGCCTGLMSQMRYCILTREIAQ